MSEHSTQESNTAIELGVRVIILSIILTILLATANAYLALKLGILTSASIPAAMLSMGILRFFKNATILENNLVQTAASAGEAVAGGIVYTIPALIIIQFWHGFDYWTNFFIALTGGVLGVLFSIPLRRTLVHDKHLTFPEGRAIAEVLRLSDKAGTVRHVLWGGVVGGVLELLQTGFQCIASTWQHVFMAYRTVLGVGIGFSPAMLGAGFLIGPVMAASIMSGAVLSWFIGVPVASHIFSDLIQTLDTAGSLSTLWNTKMRYLGIGAMLFAGLWTFLQLLPSLMRNVANYFSLRVPATLPTPSRVEHDLAPSVCWILIAFFAVLLMFLFARIFPLAEISLFGWHAHSIVLFGIAYVLLAGFLFSVVTAYFSGMVGVSASPGSSVVIAGLLLASWLLWGLVAPMVHLPLLPYQLQALEAIAIMIGAVVTGIAAIANDNTQDLKVGQLVGATPWKQQVMLLLGVLVSALVIPPVMQILYEVYGIGGIVPRPDMDPAQTLPAPAAALMAAVTEAVFQHTMPWAILLIGMAIMIAILGLRWIAPKMGRLSLLGVAIGMYLPLSTSVPIFIGGMIHGFAYRASARNEQQAEGLHRGTLIACGLLAGAALMDVLLAIPFAWAQSSTVLALVGSGFAPYAVFLAIVSTLMVARWMTKS